MEFSHKSVNSFFQDNELSKEKNKQLIDKLAKMPSMVIAIAYLYAINYIWYGEDVTEKWLTATQNAKALEKAYSDGYYDALQELAEARNKYADNAAAIGV